MNDLPWWAESDRYRHLLRRVPVGQGWSGITVGKGWAQIVVETDAALAELDPDYEIHQVKEKFGGLRYYCSLDDLDAAVEIIGRAEQRADRTCENCGSEQDVTTAAVHYWVKTLCASCRAAAET